MARTLVIYDKPFDNVVAVVDVDDVVGNTDELLGDADDDTDQPFAAGLSLVLDIEFVSDVCASVNKGTLDRMYITEMIISLLGLFILKIVLLSHIFENLSFISTGRNY